MRQILRRIFLENLGLKVVSMVLAVTIFLLVRGEKDAQVGGFVNVIYSYPANRVLVTDPPHRVRLSVRGPWARINRFDEHELDPIRVDLGDVTSGEFQFQDDLVKLPPGLRVESFNPTSVRLEFEPRITRGIPVAPVLDGVPAPGYRLERTEVEPSAVSVTGAESVVDRLTQVGTELVRISGAHGSLTRVVSLAPLPHFAEFVDEARVRVVVRILAEEGERTLAKVVVTAIGGGTGVRVEPAQVEVVVRGPKPLLADLNDAAVIAQIDLREVAPTTTGAHSHEVVVSGLAEGLQAEVRPPTVKATLGRRQPPGEPARKSPREPPDQPEEEPGE